MLEELEAQQADYRAVLATINALAAQTRGQFDRIDGRLDRQRQDTTIRFNTVDEHLSELKDLIIDLRDR